MFFVQVEGHLLKDPPNFWHFYVKDVARSAQHTTAYDM